MQRFNIPGFMLLLAAASIVTATTKNHDETFVPHIQLRFSEQVIRQSCLPAKLTVLINGTTPGPVLRLRSGRTYWIRVYNDLKEKNATMHWHGLSMATSPFSDGSPAASQWPIPPGNFFDYELHVPVGMEGTYFYHSHVGFQGISATGPLIVEGERKPPFQFDEERIFFLHDVFRKNGTGIEEGLVANPLQWSGESDMILVNGNGGGDANGTFCNSTLSTITVKPGKTYYVRFIGATALTLASIQLEDHDFEIVEADAFYVKNYKTSFLQIANGQRFGVLINTKKKPTKGAYTFQLESRHRPTLTRSFAILKYDHDHDHDPRRVFYTPTTSILKVPEIDLDFLEYKLQPRAQQQYQGFPKASEVTRRVKITAHQRIDGSTTWISNGYSWFESFPEQPYLVSLYKNGSQNFPNMTRALENGGIDPITRSFPAQIGEVIEIIIQNTGGDNGGVDTHPWHAHGSHYWDIGSGNGTYDPVANEMKLSCSPHPIKRDTTMLYRYGLRTENGTEQGWRAWRLKVENTGVWMVHCHVLQHMIMGMQTVWVMGNREEILGKVKYPDVQGYLDFGGSVVGNGTWWPNVHEHFNG